MADQEMRLRLVVRRNSLPELRLMWHVKLDSNPSISKLLEQLNDHVPLESEDWGLEDYVVELHDSDGTDFECLHYQLVRNVLKPDDRVFIRALDRDDHRRRRISGRMQISSDGRHLIDGVPFGRPNLRTPTNRPPIHIPPRKRARVAYTQPNDDDQGRGTRSESDSPVLLLTNGEPQRDDHTPSRTQAADDFDEDTDSDAEDSDYNDDDAELSSSSNESGIEQGEEEAEETDDEMEEEAEEEKEEIAQEAYDLAVASGRLGRPFNPLTARTISLETLDKVTILRSAFPHTPINIFEKVLASCHNDLKTAYNLLSQGFTPQLTQDTVMAWKPGSSSNQGAHSEQTRALASPASTQAISGGSLTRKRKFREQSPAEEPSHDEAEEHNHDLLRKYDHAGFPPGTITSGTGLKHMATISASFSSNKTNGNSETTSTTLKAATEEPMDEDDDTSSSGTSSDSSDTSSSGGGSDSDDTSSNGNSSADDDESDDASEEDLSSEDSSSQSNSADSDGSGSDSESSDDSSGEPDKLTNKHARFRSSPASESSASDNESDNESDSGPEEYPLQTTSNLVTEDKEHDEPKESSDETSSSESDNQAAEASSSSDSEEDADYNANDIETLVAKEIIATQTKSRARPPSPKSTQTTVAPISVPPGAGKESTQRRNARRRAAKLAKREMQESDTMTKSTPMRDSHVPDSEAALFEAKRKALLDAIATGGIEVMPSGETRFDQSLTETDYVKQKPTEEGGVSPQPDADQVAMEADEHPCDDQEDQSPNQKRRRIDLGAGRRLVFGALGLRNPKNQEEEAQLRDKLQADSQLRANHKVSSQPQPIADETVSVSNEEDIHAWMAKINYRAVECCHDNIELSPAPFPFQQRWDPQQQALSFFKRNKRGGQSKRAQRNQSHYYSDDSQLSKKRKRNNSYEMVGDEFDGTNETTNGDDVMLNYDDVDSQDCDNGNNPANETSQTTDLDDLPSLPEDITVLPILRPGKARVGMVITWAKWSCSSATLWQPQLSSVTGIVVRVDDDAAGLYVCLAKRDRYLDGNEKRYDHVTGQRIYDKFEAPDLDEGEADYHDAVEDGYRVVTWAEMNNPRILQEPLDQTAELDPNSNCLESLEMDERNISIENQTEPTVPIVSSQQETSAIADRVSTINEENAVDSVSKSGALLEENPEDSNLEPYLQAASNSTSHQAGQNQQTADLAMSDISQISSPSRQLHETTSQAIDSHSPVQDWIRPSSIEQAESSQPNTSSPMALPTTVSSHLGFDSDLVTGTPDLLLPRAVIPSSASSLGSGRQPDYAIDNGSSDPFNAIDDIDPPPSDGHEHNNAPSERNSLTPVPIFQPTPDHNDMTEDKGTGKSPIATPIATPIPRSSSPASSIFCTALTSHSTQSPSRAQMSSITSKSSTSRFPRDAKYEEAMRKLDEQFSEDLSDDDSPPPPPPPSSSLEVKREELTQFAPPRTLDPISPPPRRRVTGPAFIGRMRRRSQQPFTVPPGSQVVELSSDSEPVYSEDYADEDIDGTYSPELGSLPTGDGWVQKRRGKGRRSVS
ncbi:hypothetical protein F4679DRAFT_568635 [Xylaria curta]|nr:hypothetical protein F4679DRAFT_568635 [Xylaria curta]